MKKLLTVLLLGVLSVSFGQVSISNLPLYTGSSTGTIVPIVTGGVTKRMDGSKLGQISDSTKIPYLAKNNNFTGSVDTFQTIVVGGQTINQNSGIYTKGSTTTIGDWANKYENSTISINDSTGTTTVNSSFLNINSFTTFGGHGNFMTGFFDDSTLNSAGSPNSYAPSENAVKAYVANHQGGSVPYNKHYYDYRVRLYQSGTTAPTVQKVFVDEIDTANEYTGGTRVAYQYVGVGQYSVTIFSVQSKFNSIGYNTDISFSDNKITNGSYSNGSSGGIYNNVFYFNTNNSGGTPTNGLLTFSNLYIRVYY